MNELFPDLQNREWESKWYDGFKDAYHALLIPLYSKCKLYTALVSVKGFTVETMQNPELFEKEAVSLMSPIRQWIERNCRNNSKAWEWAEELVEKHYPGLRERDTKKFWKEFDCCVEGTIDSFIPRAEEALTYDWAFEKWCDSGEGSDEEEFDDLHEAYIKDKYSDELEVYRKKIYLPEYDYTYRPRYEILPKPVCFLPERNSRGQFYIIDTGDKLVYGFGSSSGSGTRFSHGIYGHLFAELVKLGSSVESVVCEVRPDMTLEILRRENKLLLWGASLTGNYPISHERSSEILEGIEKI